MLGRLQVQKGKKYQQRGGKLVIEITGFRHELNFGGDAKEHVRFKVIKFRGHDEAVGQKDTMPMDEFRQHFDIHCEGYSDHKEKLEV